MKGKGAPETYAPRVQKPVKSSQLTAIAMLPTPSPRLCARETRACSRLSADDSAIRPCVRGAALSARRTNTLFRVLDVHDLALRHLVRLGLDAAQRLGLGRQLVRADREAARGLVLTALVHTFQTRRAPQLCDHRFEDLGDFWRLALYLARRTYRNSTYAVGVMATFKISILEPRVRFPDRVFCVFFVA